ncbi:MAG TPA: energy transducer TonB [Thermodesulfobacteriota bacterium]|nr:energy transducer TonB [Thermodesulfobacteriota bacterium]
MNQKKQPDYIEITELPVPKEKETKPPEETKRLAERSHTAEKETTRDEFTKRSVALPPPQKPAVQQKPKQEVKKQEPPKTAKKAESKPKPAEKSKQAPTKESIAREDILRNKTLASLPKEQMREETGGQKVTGQKYEEREVPNITRDQLFSNVPNTFPESSQGTQDYLGARDVNMKEDTVELSTTEFRYLSYFAKLKSQIESVWNYPEESRYRGEEGQLFLVFTIKRNGELENIELISSSGYARLDNEAIRAIRSAAPYSPFPEGWGSLERLHIRATFIYQFGGFIR